MARVHVIANQKGGVGKTTVTVNLAAVTADVLGGTPEHSPVLVVSTDPQASSVWWADRVGADALPFDFTQAHNDPSALARLKTLDKYEEIFVDTPGSLEQGHILQTVLDQADDILIPILPEPLSFDPTARTIRKLIKPSGRPWSLVINAWDPRDGEADLKDTRDYIANQGWPLTNIVVRRYKIHTRASAEGLVVTHYPTSQTALKARQDFYRLALALSLWNGGNRVNTSAENEVPA